jgi:hypothetical protein
METREVINRTAIMIVGEMEKMGCFNNKGEAPDADYAEIAYEDKEDKDGEGSTQKDRD